MKTGIATFSLDYGKCPKWLFERMRTLGGIMSELIIEEFGVEEFLKRLSHPVWFQSFGSLLAFDWNSSGLTVVLTAALKSAFKERNLGIYFAGGKGKTSKRTPEELLLISREIGLDGENYVKFSKLVAKIDNSLVQDGFNLYHHVFIVSKRRSWAVIQQGMNTKFGKARRYHWYRGNLEFINQKIGNLTEEPHRGIVSDIFLNKVLNLTAKESQKNKEGIIKVLNEERNLVKEIEKIFSQPQKNLFLPDIEFHYHPVIEERFDFKRLKNIIEKAKFLEPKTIEDLLLVEGVGPKTIRALSLASEVIYGEKPSYLDPARYTFAHGGKDGTPYPIDRKTYDDTIRIFNKALKLAKEKRVFLS